MASKLKRLKKVKDKYLLNLLSKKNVRGVSIGFKEKGGSITDEASIIVYVNQKEQYSALESEDTIPSKIDGINTDVQLLIPETTDPDKPRDPQRTKRIRPIPGGVSIGNVSGQTGTSGCLVKNKKGQIFLITCAHVGAPSNRLFHSFNPSKEHYEPVPCYKYCKMPVKINRFCLWYLRRHWNKVDVSLIKPLDETMFTPYILGLGYPRGVADAVLGLPVVKAGCTTGITEGRVIAIEATINISFSIKGRLVPATFDDQIITDWMGGHGDSGAVLFTKDMMAVGMLFAGFGNITVYNKMKNILKITRTQIITSL